MVLIELVVKFFYAWFVQLLLALLLAWPAEALWNACIVPINSGIGSTGFLQMAGIILLIQIISPSSIPKSEVE